MQTYCRSIDTIVTVIDFLFEMLKVKDSRIMDLWRAVGNTLKADCDQQMKLIRWDCCSVVPSISLSGHKPYCAPPPTPHSFHPKTETAWPLRNLTPEATAPPGTCQPFTPSVGEHLEGEEGQTGRPGWAAGTYWHGNRYGPQSRQTSEGCSDCFSLVTDQIPSPPPPPLTQPHAPRSPCICWSLLLHVCMFPSLCPSLTLPLFYFFLGLYTRTMQAVMYAQLVLTEPSRKRVVYRSPVDILIWLAFHFLETWNFNCAGLSEVLLSMFDQGGKPLKNTLHPDWLNGYVTCGMKLNQKSWFLTTRAIVPHLRTLFLTKNFLSLVSLKCYSTPWFYGNNNILVVKLQAECKNIQYIWSFASVNPL